MCYFYHVYRAFLRRNQRKQGAFRSFTASTIVPGNSPGRFCAAMWNERHSCILLSAGCRGLLDPSPAACCCRQSCASCLSEMPSKFLRWLCPELGQAFLSALVAPVPSGAGRRRRARTSFICFKPGTSILTSEKSSKGFCCNPYAIVQLEVTFCCGNPAVCFAVP